MTSVLDTKTCRGCNESLPLTAFYLQKQRSGNRTPSSYCKECRKARSAANYAVSKDAVRDKQVQRLYGLNPDEYRHLVEMHGERCAICGTDSPGANRQRFNIDHDHTTGAVRGMLCHRCNTGLGFFQDDPSCLVSAFCYLGLADIAQAQRLIQHLTSELQHGNDHQL